MEKERMPFAASDIVEIGIQIEKNGRDFYSAAADKSKDPKIKEIFRYLAGEEEKHISDYSQPTFTFITSIVGKDRHLNIS